MTQKTHRIRTNYSNDDRHSWECSCGAGGSVSSDRDVDIASDKHIPEGDHRIDGHR